MRKELNLVYNSYIANNPKFVENEGKVSIIAHSLGSVIIHDVLTLWNSNLMKEHQKDADVRVASASSERFVSKNPLPVYKLQNINLITQSFETIVVFYRFSHCYVIKNLRVFVD